MTKADLLSLGYSDHAAESLVGLWRQDQDDMKRYWRFDYGLAIRLVPFLDAMKGSEFTLQQATQFLDSTNPVALSLRIEDILKIQVVFGNLSIRESDGQIFYVSTPEKKGQ